MANNYFQFKKFRVDQDRCAMKVCTDACIQGAYAGSFLKPSGTSLRILDIGTGTGLLALMLAQAVPHARLDAIEMDPMAAGQAQENFDRSPWAERLHLICGDVRQYQPAAPYDWIICNPPFYEHDLKGSHPGRNRARHALDLNYRELLQVAGAALSDTGIFCVMLPPRQYEGLGVLTHASQLYAHHVLRVKQSPSHQFFRTIGFFSRSKRVSGTGELCITDASGAYTPAFAELLRPYYLYL